MSGTTVNSLAAALEPCRAPTPKGFPFARKAAKRCYELSGRFVLDHPDAEVVHGLVGDWTRYAHAWAEIGDAVYDGTCKGFYERAGYYAVANVEPVRRFDVKELLKFVHELGHWGPCPELERAEREGGAS